MNNVAKNFQNATCFNAGTTNSFCEIDVTPQPIAQCQFACFDGTCISCDANLDCNDGNSGTIDLCNNPGTLNSFCSHENNNTQIGCFTNLDCGIDSAISVNFCSAQNISQLTMSWTCNNPGTSISYCSSNIGIDTVATCPQFCSNGSCVDIECFTHSDCNDGNSTTEDICNNAGTPSSFCTNNPIDITCFTDSDCGIDGQIDGDVCVGNDITNLFQEFTCNSSGTPLSFCSSELTQDTIQMCAFACSNGACVPAPVECGNNILEGGEDCDDGNLINGDGCSAICEIETPTCTNQCVNGARECVGNGSRVCRDYDGDGCTEWSGVAQCGAFSQCVNGACN